MAPSAVAQTDLNLLISELRVDTDGDKVGVRQLVELLDAALMLQDKRSTSMLANILKGLESGIVPGSPFVCIGRYLGRAAALLGNPHEALVLLDEALRLASKVRSRPEVALTRLEIAALLIDSYPKERSEAVSNLEFAIDELEAMGMETDLQRALLLLKGISSSRNDELAYPDGLSKREVEVLQLIADGKSNDEIAKRLFLSVRTVERHITNIYNKINVRRRVEAASYALGHNLVSIA
jgi:DNA-binding CsgD family transcriptional regulator